jgi:hypothetical protein
MQESSSLSEEQRVAAVALSEIGWGSKSAARLLAPEPPAGLKAAVTAIFEKSRARYGHRRVHTELVRMRSG